MSRVRAPDLASVQTFAERRAKWVINGHKVWTSLAHFAEWMILLLRTDKSQKIRWPVVFCRAHSRGPGQRRHCAAADQNHRRPVSTR